LTFQYCGAVYDSTNAHSETSHSTLLLRSSIYILNCTDVNVINVSIRRSKGNGLAVLRLLSISLCTWTH